MPRKARQRIILTNYFCRRNQLGFHIDAKSAITRSVRNVVIVKKAKFSTREDAPRPVTISSMTDLQFEEPGRSAPPYPRLFLDAMVVEEWQNLERVFHSAEKHPGNPVLPRDRPWEGWGPYLYGTVLPVGSKLGMWYQCLAREERRLKSRICYAESDDGLVWEKPEIGLIHHEEVMGTNILTEDTCGIASVFDRGDAVEPDDRWLLFGYGGNGGPTAAYSADGIRFRWNEPRSRRTLFQSSDVVNAFYDRINHRFVSTYKIMNRRHRAVGIAWSQDAVSWEKPIDGPVFGADDLDPDATQVYGMPVFPYHKCYIGLPWIYHARYMKHGEWTATRMYEAQDDSPRTVDVQMAWSWDLISWNRPPSRAPFIALGDESEFDRGMIYTARAPVRYGDKLLFYYGGFDKVHDEKRPSGSIGLATLRLDGFCSMQAKRTEGWFVSRREQFDTPRVRINAKANSGGKVTAEIADRWNRVIPGFSRNECIAFSGDSCNHQLVWSTQTFPTEALNAEKKIRFILKDADLYSYEPEGLAPESETPQLGQGPD